MYPLNSYHLFNLYFRVQFFIVCLYWNCSKLRNNNFWTGFLRLVQVDPPNNPLLVHRLCDRSPGRSLRPRRRRLSRPCMGAVLQQVPLLAANHRRSVLSHLAQHRLFLSHQLVLSLLVLVQIGVGHFRGKARRLLVPCHLQLAVFDHHWLRRKYFLHHGPINPKVPLWGVNFTLF